MLPHLLRRLAVSVFTTLAAALCVGVVAGGVRLLPWVASPLVPTTVILVFARLLAISAAEVALLVAAPIGMALETWRMTADHSVRTLMTLGVRPWRLAAHAAAVAAAFALLSGGVSSSWARDVRAPGVVSNRLLQAGREVCRSPHPAVVPLIGVTWLCIGGRPRLVGVAGQLPSQIAWSAADASFADDLSSASLLDVRAAQRAPHAELRVDRATVTGFAPWLAPGRGTQSTRSFAFAIVLLLTSIAASWSLVRWPARSRVVAFVVGGVGPVAFLVVADRLLSVSSLACVAGAAALALLVPVTTRLVLRKVGLSDECSGGT